ncbi:MAG TPA: type II secretion protein F [Beutenbergiaceae bacterium]|nr:type II secretion protein F [Beutenbergiaceae bacterium]
MSAVVLSVTLIGLLVLLTWAFSPPMGMRGYRGEVGQRRRAWVRRRWWPHHRRRSGHQPQFGRVLIEVAVRLRAGSAVSAAWSAALAEEFPARPVAPAAQSGQEEPPELTEAVPAALRDLATGLGARNGHGRLSRRDQQALAHQVAGAITACRVAHRVGAPMADLLHRCAQGLVEAGEAEAARRVALAGPRATARLLSWLPLAGLGLGWAWGAEPLSVLLGGGWGGVCLVAGAILMVGGRVWVNRLVRTAEGAGQ